MNKHFIDSFIHFSRELYQSDAFIPLHEPRFPGNEKKYVLDTIESTFVSSVGQYVTRFEKDMASYTGAGFAVAVGNGTSALHIALLLGGVREGDEVITQALSFIATSNAISYLKAYPVYIDVDRDTLGMSASRLEAFLTRQCARGKDGFLYNKNTGRRISACVPMHTFGFPCRIEEISAICKKYKIVLIEDAAESIGSFVGPKHTGTFGLFGILSFNGNKTITTGGGGMIISNDKALSELAKHITTTAKVPHKWEYVHDKIGYNYRLPNLNAALGVAQLENLPMFLEKKKELAEKYTAFFKDTGVDFFEYQLKGRPNFWLNAIILRDFEEREKFLRYTNDKGIMTRPIWKLTHKLEMFKDCYHDDLTNSEWLEERVVNIPSSVIL